jgi:deoxyadenosine/deoxycytidine kinase
MYYLTIKNLGTEKCIDKNIEDIYEDDQYFSFLPDFFFVKTRIVKIIKIKCIEMPGSVFDATVYSD